MSVVFIKPGPKLQLKDVETLEVSIKATLPPSYVRFLALNNGGYSHQYSVRYTDANLGTEQQADIFHWLAIGSNKERDGFLGVGEAIQNMGGVLKFDHIPIAVDASGAPILLSVRRSDHGRVVFFDQDAPDERSLNELARGFSEFISSLVLTRRRDL